MSFQDLGTPSGSSRSALFGVHLQFVTGLSDNRLRPKFVGGDLELMDYWWNQINCGLVCISPPPMCGEGRSARERPHNARHSLELIVTLPLDCCIDTSLLHTNRFDTNTSIPFTHFLLFSTEERERSSFLRKLWGPLTGSVPTNLSELCSDSPEGDATTMLLDHLLSDHLQITCLKISFFSCFWTLRFGQSSVRLKSWKLFSWACPRGWFDLHRAY